MMKWVADMIHWMTQNYSNADQMFEKQFEYTLQLIVPRQNQYIPSVVLAQVSLYVSSRIKKHLVDKINWHFSISSSILNLEITICGLDNCEPGETNNYQWWSSWCRQWDPTPKHSLSHLLALSSPTLLHIYTFICVWDALILQIHALHLMLWKSTTLYLNNLNDALFCPILWTGRTTCKRFMLS